MLSSHVSGSVASALIGLWSTYLLGLLAPGPNFFAIAGLSALNGFRSSLALIAGIVAGSCLQVIAVATTISVLSANELAGGLGRIAGALLLFVTAVRIWRMSQRPLEQVQDNPGNWSVRMLTGVPVGLFNPITFAGLTAQLLGPSAILLGSRWWLVAAAGIALLGLTRSLLIACLFAAAPLRRAVQAKRRLISIPVALAFAVLGIGLLSPLFDFGRAIGAGLR